MTPNQPLNQTRCTTVPLRLVQEPDIDTIFMVLNKCGKPCEHISQITG
ncbi:MAG: hypothetical protein GY820_46700 [Gammaproteobacteria bacterium]|nr:hypothetical protein [Gammaproteobacteria bacterium]